MITSKLITTKITYELSTQDVQKWLIDSKLVPSEWDYYSINVEGLGISKGAKITIENQKVGK